MRQLAEPYGSALTRVYRYVLPLAKGRPLGSEEFTDHDIAHSTRLVERMGRLLPSDVQLNQPELYVLLLGALLHDLGMWIPRDEAHHLLTTEDHDFFSFCRRYHANQFETVREALASESATLARRDRSSAARGGLR